MCSLAVRCLSVHALCVGVNSLFTHVFTSRPRPLLPSCQYTHFCRPCGGTFSTYTVGSATVATTKQTVSASPWLLVVCACWIITAGDMVSCSAATITLLEGTHSIMRSCSNRVREYCTRLPGWQAYATLTE